MDKISHLLSSPLLQAGNLSIFASTKFIISDFSIFMLITELWCEENIHIKIKPIDT